MARIITIIAFMFTCFLTASAQNDNVSPLNKGSFLIEANTGTFATGSTAFSLVSVDGTTSWSIGGEGGFFIKDNLVLKLGLGYGNSNQSNGNFVYKVGVKYYVSESFPVGIDITGITMDGFNTNWAGVGVQGGYAWFLAPNVSIEPTLRYNKGINSNNLFQALIGFVFYL